VSKAYRVFTAGSLFPRVVASPVAPESNVLQGSLHLSVFEVSVIPRQLPPPGKDSNEKEVTHLTDMIPALPEASIR